MKIVIVFASTEGQTEKVAHYVLHWLAGAGHAGALMPAALARRSSLDGYDAAIVAGSVHVGHYQKELCAFVREARPSLSGMPTLFLSVSLAAAGDVAEDWQGLRDCVRRFERETGWTPGRVEHVAGAFRFSEYGFLKHWAMRWIASQRDEEVSGEGDREYTDWSKLAGTLADWTATLGQHAG